MEIYFNDTEIKKTIWYQQKITDKWIKKYHRNLETIYSVVI